MNYTVWLTILVLFTALFRPTPAYQAVSRQRLELFQPAPADPNYRLGTLEAVTCSDTSAFFRKDSSLTTVSVSPSGNCIAAVDRSKMSMQDKHAAGVGNPLGRLPGVIYLFSRQDDGYAMSRIIRVDRETQLELSSILGAGASISWNEAETRCIVSYKWGAGSENAASVNYYHSNLYLIDLIDGTIRRLTENSEACEHCVLPAWYGPDRVRFIRLTNQGGFRNDLCEIDLETGQETTLAALYSAGGSVSVVYDWQVSWERIYYIVDAYAGGTGFYVSPLRRPGIGSALPRQPDEGPAGDETPALLHPNRPDGNLRKWPLGLPDGGRPAGAHPGFPLRRPSPKTPGRSRERSFAEDRQALGALP